MTRPNGVSVYDIGDLVQARATIIGTDGVTPAQPSYFAFLVKNGSGVVATYVFGAASVVNPGAGAFFLDINVDSAGSWFYRSVATGLIQSAEEWSFLARESQFIL